ncbi:MAG TPA: LysE/ArgO family amino acid transporter [Bacillota bacterium]|nr:LysE/ArgO family amino acid transporter [Bacillota bacterium]
MLSAFLHGWILSFGLIMPLGVQNVFVFNQGAQNRRWFRALPTVLTAAVCDSLLILLAVGGVSLLVLKTPVLRYLLILTGVAFLTYMAILTWRAKPDPSHGDEGAWPVKRQVLFAATVSLLNPHAIIDTIGVIGGSSVAYLGEARIAFAGGCLVNSWIWFFALMTSGHLIGALPNAVRILRWFNRLSAVIMLGCAVLLLKTLFL